MTNESGIRLETSTVVTIPPYNIAILPLEPPLRALHCKSVNTDLFEGIGNPLSCIEHPYLLFLNMLHKFGSRYPKQCVAIAVNVSDKDIISNKGMTLCFVQETDLTVDIPQAQDTNTVNTINNEEGKIDNKRETIESKENGHNGTEKTSSYTREFGIYVS